MNLLFSRMVQWHEEHDLVLNRALADNMKRFPWVFVLLLAFYALGLWHSWNQAHAVNAVDIEIMRAMGWLDVVMMCWIMVSLGLFLGFRRRPYAFLLNRMFPIVASVVFLLYAVVATQLLQWLMPSVTLYVLACVFVGTLVLERPSVMMTIFAASYIALFMGLYWTPVPTLMRHTEQLHASIAAVLGCSLSVVLWRRFSVTELLKDQVALQNQVLQRQNAELVLQKAEFEKLAQHDALTGLLNRRALEAQAEIALRRASRDHTGLAAMMLDLDLFKTINDQHGHPVGDAVIKCMADALRSSVRATDLVARSGGEEFMVVLPDTTEQAAVSVAEKIRLRMAQTGASAASGVTLQVTVSVGVAAFIAGQNVPFEALYSAADQALYLAKQRGRNRVEVALVQGS